MKLKLRQIVESVQGMNALMDSKLPVKIAYRLNKLANNQISREIKDYEEQRVKLVKEYGDKDEAGQVSVSDPKKLEEFLVKINELQDVDVEIDFERISIESLGDIAIEPKNIISWLFSDETQEATKEEAPEPEDK